MIGQIVPTIVDKTCGTHCPIGCTNYKTRILNTVNKYFVLFFYFFVKIYFFFDNERLEMYTFEYLQSLMIEITFFKLFNLL